MDERVSLACPVRALALPAPAQTLQKVKLALRQLPHHPVLYSGTTPEPTEPPVRTT